MQRMKNKTGRLCRCEESWWPKHPTDKNPPLRRGHMNRIRTTRTGTEWYCPACSITEFVKHA